MNNTDTETPVWERNKGETVKAYQAFVVYRDMGKYRTIRKAAKLLSKSVTHIANWSSKYNWVKRIEKYEDYLSEKSRIEHEELIKAAKLREVTAGTAMMEKLQARLDTLKPDEITPNLLTQLAKTASELARLGLDVYTQSSRTEITGPDGQVLPSLPAFRVVFEDEPEKKKDPVKDE